MNSDDITKAVMLTDYVTEGRPYILVEFEDMKQDEDGGMTFSTTIKQGNGLTAATASMLLKHVAANWDG